MKQTSRLSKLLFRPSARLWLKVAFQHVAPARRVSAVSPPRHWTYRHVWSVTASDSCLLRLKSVVLHLVLMTLDGSLFWEFFGGACFNLFCSLNFGDSRAHIAVRFQRSSVWGNCRAPERCVLFMHVDTYVSHHGHMEPLSAATLVCFYAGYAISAHQWHHWKSAVCFQQLSTFHFSSPPLSLCLFSFFCSTIIPLLPRFFFPPRAQSRNSSFIHLTQSNLSS